MSRKSRADLAVIPMTGAGRPPPPPDLDAIEAHIWRSVVDSSPAFVIDGAALWGVPSSISVSSSLSSVVSVC